MFPIVEDWSEVYDCNTLLNKLPGYDSSQGVNELLDLSRIINESGNYLWYGLVFPRVPVATPFTTILGGQTVNGSVVVPAGSIVTSINVFSDQPEGIKFELYDKGTKASIFYGKYQVASTVAGLGGPDSATGSDIPVGCGFLTSPFIITPPGVLNWEAVNMSANDAMVQFLVNCAVPINRQTLGTKIVKKG